ncbi:putative dithiol-disulfide oxidoreductase (DUF899 family) [Kibdelosporangium banguiense]|uniref:Dithiol-disulfide oxidoreductase (DUF899 family) n=1 Tax=Kibdelosporangium banguiense TaxID=1365924 RepID=A0ABS4T8I2_9PSEU|nr:DUF899 family protein [Kibdelosporangium banguiense]MBP2320732.1 putative dithiol-disulfide oxidoreductase (DUF899 family) [Kibdelosporangium banguiense]
MNRPAVVSASEWQAARDELLVHEKELTRATDALAAARRRLPMVQLSTGYSFAAPSGSPAGLLDLFDGKQQLVVYHFMLSPGSSHICGGCSSFTDNLATDQTHLNARDTRLILMSPAPQSEISVVRNRFGWTHPWYSGYGNSFYSDLDLGDGFGLSVLLRDGSDVFRTYYTSARGVDRLRTDFNLLDLTPYGRKEVWEDSPDGWPQEPTWNRVRLRDEY